MKLTDMTVNGFTALLGSEAPAPGGGSAAALAGALGAALTAMVASLTYTKAKYAEYHELAHEVFDKASDLQNKLLKAIDEDTEAFNRIMAAFGLPKKTDEDKAARSAAIQEATLYATQVPLHTMQASFRAFEICRAMAEEGNPNSVSDAGVGALAARAAVLGAGLNVKINAGSLKDREVAEKLIAEANELIVKANAEEAEILKIVESKL